MLKVLRSRAFTLLELIVAIILLGVLAALAVPTFVHVIERSKDGATKTTLSAIARDAQALHAFDSSSPWSPTQIETAISETSSSALSGLWADGPLVPVASSPSSSTRPQPGQVVYAIDNSSSVFGLAMRSGSKVCALAADASKILASGCVASSDNPAQDVIKNPSSWSDGSASGNSNGGTNSGGSDDVLLAPLNVTASAHPSDPYSVDVSWSSVAGAASFKVERSVNGGSWAPLSTLSSTRYLDSAVTPGSSYSYRVFSQNASSSSVASRASASVTIVPRPVTGLTANVDVFKVALSWDASAGASSYSVFRADTETLIGVTSSASWSGTLPGGFDSELYVVASNAGGSAHASDGVAVKTAPSLDVFDVSPSTESLVFSWQSKGASSFVLERSLSADMSSSSVVYTGSAFTFADAPTPGVEMFYRLSASSSAGTSVSDVLKASRPLSIPASPDALAASVSGLKVSLSWNEVPFAAGYRIFKDDVFAGVSDTTSYETSLPAGSSASFKVLAYNAAGASAWSSPVSAQVAPAAPSNLALSSSGSSVSLTWSPSAGASKYILSYGDQTLELSSAETSAELSLNLGSTTTFSLYASNAAGNSAAASKTLTLPPAPPSNFKAEAKDTEVTLTWDASVGASAYLLELDGVSAGIWVASPATLTLPVGSTASISLLAQNAGGESSKVYASVSSVPPAPSGLQVTLSGNTASLTWSASPAASSYVVYKNSLPVATTTSLSWSGSFASGETFTLGVQALNAAGSSAINSLTSQTAPSAPKNLTASLSGGDVLLSWDLVPGASGYVVTSDGSNPVSLGASTHQLRLSQTAGSTVLYGVSASNSAGSASSSVSFTQIPDAPSGLSAWSASGTVSLKWNASPGATSYALYQNGSYIGSASSTSFNATLATGVDATFTVTSLNSAGESAPSASVAGWGALQVPTGLSASMVRTYTSTSASDPGYSTVTLTWNPVSHVHGYRVHITTNMGNFMDTFISTPTYKVFGLRDGEIMTASVASQGDLAPDATGINYEYSAYSSSVSMAPLTSVPSPIASGTSTASLSWPAVYNATSYNVSYSLTGDSSDTIVVSSSTSWSKAVPAGAVLTAKVASVSAAGTSAYSSSVSVSNPPSAPSISSSYSGANVNLSWASVPYATSYTVSYTVGSTPTSSTVSGTSASIPMAIGESRTFTVTANAPGGSKAASVTLTRPVPAPASLTLTGIRGSTENYTWSAVSGASSYTLTLGAYSTTVTGTSASLTVANGYAGVPSVVAKANGTSSSATTAPSVTGPSNILTNRVLTPGTSTSPANANTTYNSSLVSDNGRYAAVMQADGNFVLYDLATNASYAWTGVGGNTVLNMQGDGNLVLYLNGAAVRNTGTYLDTGRTVGNLVMQSDGNLVLYNSNYTQALWASAWGTGQRHPEGAQFFSKWP